MKLDENENKSEADNTDKIGDFVDNVAQHLMIQLVYFFFSSTKYHNHIIFLYVITVTTFSSIFSFLTSRLSSRLLFVINVNKNC